MTTAAHVRSIWLDDDDASEHIDTKVSAGDITSAEAEGLRKFADDEYVIVKVDRD